jgi:hypothetical protein
MDILSIAIPVISKLQQYLVCLLKGSNSQKERVKLDTESKSSVVRTGFEVTSQLQTMGGVSSSEFVWNRKNLRNTIFDPCFMGKDVYIDLLKVSNGTGFPMYEDGIPLQLILIPWDLRKDLKKNYNGTYLLSGLLASANELAGEVSKAKVSGDIKRVQSLVTRTCCAYAEELLRTLNIDLARPRNKLSGNLVAVPDIRHDIFSSLTAFKRGLISDLRPGEIGVSTKVLNKINNGRDVPKRIVKNGDYFITSRWPCTDVRPMKIVERNEHSFVAYVSADWFTTTEHEAPIQQMKLFEGDNDGDTLFFNFVTHVAEVMDIYDKFMDDVTVVPFTPMSLTYLDHEVLDCNELQIATDKADQKNWIMPLSAAMYAGYAFMENREQQGLPVNMTKLEWCETMTQALELCFDKKHNNNSNPRPLYGMLQAKEGYTWNAVVKLLEVQNLNIDILYKMHEMLDGQSLREAASANLPFKVVHQMRGADTKKRLQTIEALLQQPELCKWFVSNLVPSLQGEC